MTSFFGQGREEERDPTDDDEEGAEEKRVSLRSTSESVPEVPEGGGVFSCASIAPSSRPSVR